MKIEKTMPMMAFETFVKCATHSEIDPRRDRIKKESPIKSWLHEWCTYRFGMQRQSGHTLNSLYVLPRYFEYITFLYHNQNMVKYAKDYMEEMKRDNEEYAKIMKTTKVDFMTVHKFTRDQCYRGFHYFPNCVCVDVSSMLSKTITEKIVDSCCGILSASGRREFKLFFIE